MSTIDDLDWLDHYDVVWNQPSRDSSGAMPCGGGGVGLVVWVEAGSVLFYVDRSGSFDENNQMLKLGRIRVDLDPNPFIGQVFAQRLVLRDGVVRINGDGPAGSCTVEVWVDVHSPSVHVDVRSERPVGATAVYEHWRTADRELDEVERVAASVSFQNTRADRLVVRQRADVVEVVANEVVWWHRNDDRLLFDDVVTVQHLDAVREQLWNPQRDFVFGGRLRGDGFASDGVVSATYGATPFRGERLTAQARKTHRLDLTLHHGRYAELEQWRASLPDVGAVDAARSATRAWWAAFWRRSRVVIGGDAGSPEWRVARNYQLFRHLLGCNLGGDHPMKFNGGLFTCDPPAETGAVHRAGTPDYRAWGGGSATAQNQRLVHFPMLRSGDFDLLAPQLDFYLRALPAAEARTRVYWDHAGASFTEQMENFGLPCLSIYDWRWDEYGARPRPGDDYGSLQQDWCSDLYDTVLEFGLMILDLEDYAGADVRRWLPVIESSLVFFDEHYRFEHRRRVGEDLERGRLVLEPASAAETYKDARDPITTVAGLSVLCRRVLDGAIAGTALRARAAAMLDVLPDLPTRILHGYEVLSPARSWSRINNEELPQLYPVYPWGIYGVGRPDLELARRTFEHGADEAAQHGIVGWKQDGIFAARLALVDTAAELLVAKLDDAPRRYPAFWGPGFDWTPDLNHGGSGAIALQEMLLQSDGKRIHVCPSWPARWDVDFTLHAPRQTRVTASVRAGRIVHLAVDPTERIADVELHLPGPTPV